MPSVAAKVGVAVTVRMATLVVRLHVGGVGGAAIASCVGDVGGQCDTGHRTAQATLQTPRLLRVTYAALNAILAVTLTWYDDTGRSCAWYTTAQSAGSTRAPFTPPPIPFRALLSRRQSSNGSRPSFLPVASVPLFTYSPRLIRARVRARVLICARVLIRARAPAQRTNPPPQPCREPMVAGADCGRSAAAAVSGGAGGGDVAGVLLDFFERSHCTHRTHALHARTQAMPGRRAAAQRAETSSGRRAR